MIPAKKISLIVFACLMASSLFESIAQAQNCLPFRRRAWMVTQLLQRPPVQQELQLSTEQRAKLRDISQQLGADIQALYKGLSPDERRAKQAELQPQVARLQQQAQMNRESVLTEEQRQRLGQISLQILGAAGLTKQQTARQLRLTSAQQQAVTTARQELDTGEQALRDKRREGKLSNQQVRAERRALCRQTEQKLLDILTQKQRTAFETMQGPPSRFGQRWRGGNRIRGTEREEQRKGEN